MDNRNGGVGRCGRAGGRAGGRFFFGGGNRGGHGGRGGVPPPRLQAPAHGGAEGGDAEAH